MKASLLFVFGILFSNVACATTPSAGTAQNYRWYEMGEAREIFLEDGLVAVFSDGISKPKSNTIRSNSVGVLTLEKQYGSVRLYRSEGQVNAKSVASLSVPGSSPVFKSSAEGGRRMALPGTILVQFKSDTDESQAKSWAVQMGMSLVRKQTFPKNSFVFLHQPGLASLEMANKLQETSEIEWAQPDWWLEVSRR